MTSKFMTLWRHTHTENFTNVSFCLNFVFRLCIGLISPLPAIAEGDFRFALRPSVRPSVCHASVFRTFFLNAYRYSADILCKFRSGRMIFVWVTALGLRKICLKHSFPHFFSKRLQIFSWYFACRSTIMSYKASLSFILVGWFLSELRPLDFENFPNITVFRIFF